MVKSFHVVMIRTTEWGQALPFTNEKIANRDLYSSLGLIIGRTSARFQVHFSSRLTLFTLLGPRKESSLFPIPFSLVCI